MNKVDENMTSAELEKENVLIVVEIIEYVPDSVVITTVIEKATESINAVSFDTVDKLEKKSSPLNKFIQIIEGRAEVVIDEQSTVLERGESIIIPAHSSHTFKSDIRFKMISSVIKSGHDNGS